MQPHQRTTVKLALLGLLLEASGYEETSTHYLVEGFRQGFHLRLNRPIDQITLDKKVNKSTLEGNNNPQAMEAKLEKVLLAKRMIRPFLVISPLGLRKKKVPGKFRVIHDLSAPFEGISVNSCILTRYRMVTYDTVDIAIQLIQRVG